MSNQSAIIDLGNISLDHPAVGAVSLYSSQAGYLNIKDTISSLKSSGIPTKLLPPEPGNSVALKRAVEDAAKGNKNRRVESKGKFGKAVYSIINIDRENIDLEESTGKGIADSEVSVRVEENGVGGESLVITPNDHHQADYIRQRYEYHREHFKAPEDLSKWLSQKVMPSAELRAISRPGHGGGLYYVPKGPGFDLALKLRDALNTMSTFDSNKQLVNGVKLYVQPVFTQFSDCVDALTDAMLDDFEKVTDGINSYLTDFESGDINVRFKGLETKAKEAANLRKKLENFSKACGLSLDDLTPRIKAIETRISMAEVVLAG